MVQVNNYDFQVEFSDFKTEFNSVLKQLQFLDGWGIGIDGEFHID